MLEEREIALRSEDVQTGIQDIQLSGPATGFLDDTRLVGMAARLATHIRGAEIITDYSRLRAVASRLGIDTLVLPNVLATLEEAEFVSIKGSTHSPTQIDERVPYFSDVYDRLGDIWISRSPAEPELVTVELLDQLISSPISVTEIKRRYGLNESDLELVQRIGEQAGYYGSFVSSTDEEEIIYSPLYWEQNPEQTSRLLERFGSEEISSAVQEVRHYQGLPLPLPDVTSDRKDQVLVEAMRTGLLPSPEVTSLSGSRRFAFTPYQGRVGLSAVERPVLAKARAILACVRYGQHFGTITRVNNPAAILSSLRQNKKIGPHTEIATQYAILVIEGVARITKARNMSSRYILHLIDTEDNLKALDLAIDLLTHGEAISGRSTDAEARTILFNGGTVKDPGTVRSNDIIRRPIDMSLSSETITSELLKLVDDVRLI